MPIQSCPCCSHRLLMHVRHAGVYWFCRHCWQEMPITSGLDARPVNAPFEYVRRTVAVQPSPLINLSSSLDHLKVAH